MVSWEGELVVSPQVGTNRSEVGVSQGELAHGNNRTSQMQRFRQRFMHKLVYFPANNDGMYSCVGCGRCVDKCPASLNIVKVIKAFENQGGDR